MQSCVKKTAKSFYGDFWRGNNINPGSGQAVTLLLPQVAVTFTLQGLVEVHDRFILFFKLLKPLSQYGVTGSKNSF